MTWPHSGAERRHRKKQRRRMRSAARVAKQSKLQGLEAMGLEDANEEEDEVLGRNRDDGDTDAISFWSRHHRR